MSQNDTKQQTNRYSTNKLAVTFFSASTQEEEEDGRSAANMNTIYLSSKVRWYSQQQQQWSYWFCNSKQKNGKKKLICCKAPWLSPLIKIQTSLLGGWVPVWNPPGMSIVLLSQYRNNTFTIWTTNLLNIYLNLKILTLAPDFLILKFLVGNGHANY